MEYKSTLLHPEDIERILKRIAHQIIEKNHGTEDICLVGIRTRGVPLAYRLAENIAAIEGKEIAVGELDITLYRDDLSLVGETPRVRETKIDFDVTGKTVVLVDDVIYTGRTARAAIEAVCDTLCAVGKNIPTSVDEAVAVRLRETDDEEAVKIYVKN